MISPEDKFEAALAVLSGQKTAAEIGERYGVREEDVAGWADVLRAEGPGLFGASPTNLYKNLYEVARITASVLNVDVLLPLIVNQVQQAMGYARVRCYLTDAEGENIILRADSTPPQSAEEATAINTPTMDEAVLALMHGAEAYIQEGEQPRFLLPIMAGERLIGVLTITAERPFSALERDLLPGFADSISVAVENAQLFGEIQSRVVEITTLNTIAGAVMRARTTAEVFAHFEQEVPRTFGRSGFVALFEEGGLHIAAETGEGSYDLTPDDEEYLYAASENEDMLYTDRHIFVPLYAEGRALGVVGIMAEAGDEDDHELRRILMAYAGYISAKLDTLNVR